MEHLLYDYFRSTAAYRVRIALNLKGIQAKHVLINLIPGVDEQKSDHYQNINPQGRVPTYIEDDFVLGQSPAILEYLEDCYPSPALLPSDPHQKAKVRQLCAIIGCDIHPLNNLSVLQYLKNQLAVSEDSVSQWYSHWVTQGFDAIEALLVDSKFAGNPYCFGTDLTLADIYLTAQVYNAIRFNVDVSDYPMIMNIDAACRKLPEFKKAAPENQ